VLVLSQVPSPAEALGVALVVAAVAVHREPEEETRRVEESGLATRTTEPDACYRMGKI
jgi:hypothetical protein